MEHHSTAASPMRCPKPIRPKTRNRYLSKLIKLNNAISVLINSFCKGAITGGCAVVIFLSIVTANPIISITIDKHTAFTIGKIISTCTGILFVILHYKANGIFTTKSKYSSK